MSTGGLILLILIVLLVAGLPTWPYSRGWGYYPTGGLGLVVVIIVILLLMGRNLNPATPSEGGVIS